MDYEYIEFKKELAFAKSLIKDFDSIYEVFKATPEELVGRKVISIRSGFSSSSGGQIMLIDKADETKIRLIPCKESKFINDSHLGWGCGYNERHHSFIFYKKENIRTDIKK